MEHTSLSQKEIFQRFRSLPEDIKNTLSSTESYEMVSLILQKAELGEGYRQRINLVIVKIFIDDIVLESLPMAIQKEFKFDPQKSIALSDIIKTALTPFKDFFESAAKVKNASSVPQGNVVNLAKPKASL